MRAHLARAAAAPYDLVFLNGDSLSHLETEGQVLERCLRPASELFASRTPLLLVRGNHETRGAFARELGRYLDLPDGRFYYSFDHGPVHFIVMDTGEDKEDGHWAYSGLTGFDAYRQKEAEWLAREVASPAWRQARFRVLVAHMPFFGNERTRVEGHGPADVRQRWGSILNEPGSTSTSRGIRTDGLGRAGGGRQYVPGGGGRGLREGLEHPDARQRVARRPRGRRHHRRRRRGEPAHRAGPRSPPLKPPADLRPFEASIGASGGPSTSLVWPSRSTKRNRRSTPPPSSENAANSRSPVGR